MSKLNKQQSKAFTIIEVVLVLAVAGLIFLVVFAAVPRLQASRRDNQRKRDAEALFALVVEYQSNTGSLPTTTIVHEAFDGAPSAANSGFLSYLEAGDFADPSGSFYAYDATPDEPTDIRYLLNYRCNPAASNYWTSTPGQGVYLVRIGLERGTYCLDNYSG